MRGLVVGTLVLFAVLLGGCSGSDQSATSAPTAEPTLTSPSPEPDPAITATPPTATSEPTPTATPTPEPARPTIDQLFDLDTPLSLAHAGGDQDAPHSTMFAFKEAVAAGVDILEVDVQLSGDGQLIVHHDATLERTSNGQGLALDLTVAELQTLDNAFWFAEECWPCADLDDSAYLYRGVRTGDRPPPLGYTPDDFAIITFRALAEQFPQMPFDIEIKGELPQALAVIEVLATEIEALNLTESVVVVSFDDAVVAAFEAAAPAVETSPGTDELTFWVLAGVPLEGHRIVQVPPEFEGLEVVNEAFIELAEEAGVEVWVWPNDASQENTDFYRRLLDLGADGIITGRPLAMEAARR